MEALLLYCIHGTLFQIQNKLGRNNVISDPTKDFNACDDFFQVVISLHIIAATMKVLKMKSANDTPTPYMAIGAKPEDVWMLGDEEWKKVLDNVCNEVVEKFTDFSFVQGSLEKMVCFPMQRNSWDQVCLTWSILKLKDVIVTYSQYFFVLGGLIIPVKCSTLMLHQSLTLPPRLAAQLLWSRFV